MRRAAVATRLAGTALLVAAGLAAPVDARAQEVTIKMRLPPQVIAEIQEALREVTQETIEGVSSAIREVHRALPELERMLREVEGLGQSQSSSRNRQASRETRSVRVPADGTLEVRHTNGPVTVVAGSGSQVELTLEHRSARTVRGRTAGQQAGLLRITERGSRTIVEGPADATSDAALTVTAPAGTNISIVTITGAVSVTGMEGQLSIETAVGGITVRDCPRLSSVKSMTGAIEVSGVDHDGALEASTINGTLTLAHVRARQISADNVTGEIVATDVRAAVVDMTTMSGQVSFTGDLQRSGRYEFHSHNGTLVLSLGGAGYSLDATTVRGRVQVAGQLGLRPATRSSQAVRGVVGDGSATVAATAFNGEITIRGRK